MPSSGMLRRLALVRTDVSEERSASFIRVTGIGELETTQAVTSNLRTLRRSEEAHGVTSQKTEFFIVTAVKTSSTVFLDMIPCNMLKVGRRFVGTYRLHHQL
jgi:hypothetical protein